LRDLLRRLDHPDYPGLPALVVRELNHDQSRGFGHFAVHRLLLTGQMEACLKLKPDLIHSPAFIQVYLSKLRPAPDTDIEGDLAARAAWLDHLLAFAEQLAPAQNSVKAAILYHRLDTDRRRGLYNRDLFMRYIALPRPVPYINEQLLLRGRQREQVADLAQNYSAAFLLGPVGNDEPLIREYLAHFFTDAAEYDKALAEFIREDYLRPLFAETKLLAGAGDAERWYAWLTPGRVQALRDRVDLDFSPANPRIFSPGEPVSLEVDVKNVERLAIRIFRVNALNVYRDTGREIDTTLELDGLVPNHEREVTFALPPIRRVRRTFELPEISEPGLYVVEFVGGGISSRAVVRLGRMRYVMRNGPAGHVFRILDESNTPVNGASLHIDGHQFTPDAQGAITVPYSTAPGNRTLIMARGDWATLDQFQHEAEVYGLHAGFHLDRETLSARQVGAIILRPRLWLSGQPLPLELLEDALLTVTSSDHDDYGSAFTRSGLALTADQDTVVEFKVPERLKEIRFTLSGRIKSLSTGEYLELNDTTVYEINAVHRSEQMIQPLLTRDGDEHVVELRGRNGEPLGRHPANLLLKHRDLAAPMPVALQSDAEGRIRLGGLEDVQWVTIDLPGQGRETWPLREDRADVRRTLTGSAGRTLLVPWMRPADVPRREEVALLERRGDSPAIDRFDHLVVADGYLQLRDLPAGDYELILKRDNQRIAVHVVEGREQWGHALSAHRYLELTEARPVTLRSITADAERVRLRVGHPAPGTRVHVVATRFVPPFDGFEALRVGERPEAMIAWLPGSYTLYVEGRDLGDEYRYILDRRRATRFPGNMLPRPGLLLNPWAVRDTETGEQRAAEGAEYLRVADGRQAARRRAEAAAVESRRRVHGLDTDFLAEPARVFANLRPDADGYVTIDRAELGDRSLIHAVVTAGDQTVARSLALPLPEMGQRELRLVHGLDPQRHFVQHQQTETLREGDAVTVRDLGDVRMEAYDTLAKVFTLFSLLAEDPAERERLEAFRFILEWPDLDEAQQREKYSEHASHELHFFLYHKDRSFFDAVVRPYLAHKRDKTFLDHYLLDGDLRPYAERWAFAQLNTAERTLLGRRLGRETDVARHVRDRFELLPPDAAQRDRRFQVALRAGAMSEGALLDAVVTERAPAPSLDGDTALGGGRALEAVARRSRVASGIVMEEAEIMEAAVADDMVSPGEVDSLASGEEAFGYKDLSQVIRDRQEVRRFYRALDATREWAEQNYYRRRIADQHAGLVEVNRFWRDVADHGGEGPLLSPNLAEAAGSFSEMMLALSLLDLPFAGGAHGVSMQEGDIRFEGASPSVLFYNEVREAEPAEATASILVSENVYKLGDRHRIVGGERVDHFIAEEFVVHQAYGGHVVVTNPTSSRQRLDVLMQIPRGAIPLKGSSATITRRVELDPYQTQSMEYYFYFPEPGAFSQFPVHIALREQLVAFDAPMTFRVVREPTIKDTASWDYLSQHGSTDDVIRYLETHNVEEIDLARIAWRMRDREVFERVITLLDRRLAYNPVLWSYGILHDHRATIRQYLRFADAFVAQCGRYLESPLLVIDPVERRTHEFLEYEPFVQPRTYLLGSRRRLVNPAMAAQYLGTLDLLAHRPALDDDDHLAVAYHLLLQNRVEEALGHFARVRRDRLATGLQYDYFAAYLAFHTEDLATARRLADAHAGHPVKRWADRFDALRRHLDEVEGRGGAALAEADREAEHERLARSAPSIEIEVEGDRIGLAYANLEAVEINYYLMDLELMFSNQPFVQAYGGQFAYIRPNASQRVELDPAGRQQTVEIPDGVRRRHVMIEALGGGVRRVQTHVAGALQVRMVENYGQLHVTAREDDRPLPGVYVKVYARMADGGVRFFKDGYTDLRGRFDYASVSGEQQTGAERFSILVLSDELGAQVREVAPPRR